MAKVYIAPGHGGADPGAVGNGLKEKDLNLSIGKYCAEYLKASGVTVKMSRTKDIDPGLNQRAAEANKWGADLVCEIHINAGGGDGAEVYYSIVGGTSKKMAQNIEAEIKKIGQNSRGIKTKKNAQGQDFLGIIRMTKAPAVLVECAFIDTKDIKIIDTKAEQKIMGEAIAKGILKTLGVKAEDKKAAEDKPAEDEKAEFKVKVTANALNVRSGPGTKYEIKTVIRDKGIYTITETSGSWGKLKSGAGWISLNYCRRM